MKSNTSDEERNSVIVADTAVPPVSLSQPLPTDAPVTTDPDVWVGVKRCGCCVAVAVDNEELRKETEKSKREFLNSGLSVIRVSWSEWRENYMPRFMKCKHEATS